MSDVTLRPPDLNLKIRIRTLAKVLYDLTDVCGVKCETDIKKGVLDRQIVDRITVCFFDKSGVVKGEIIFQIDWNKLEILAKTDKDATLLNKIDFNRLVAPQLDQALYLTLKTHVDRLKKEHVIEKARAHYHYRSEYNANTEVFNQTMQYMGHDNNYKPPQRDIRAMNYELKVAFQGLDGCLDVLFRS